MKFLSLTAMVWAFTLTASATILPPNDLYIPAGEKLLAGGLTEEQFNEVIEKIENVYAPVISGLGGKLRIARKWDDGTVNANAVRFGSVWNVNMYGGLARHAAITEDGFSLVLCHEIGHHIGGAPKTDSFFGFNRWASNEGQSDYWATLKCLRQVWLHEDNAVAVAKLTVPATLKTRCEQSWKDKNDQDICVRGGMAGVSVAGLFAAIRNRPEASFDTPDTKVVKTTFDGHPEFQCRLDTYLQGALCEKTTGEEVSQKDEVKGTCHGSTDQKVGLRPLCWFKPSK